LLSGAGSRPIH